MLFNVEHPLAYYGTLSAAMSVCLYFFVRVVRNLKNLSRRVDGLRSEVGREAGVLGAQVTALEARVGEWAWRIREGEEKVSSLSALRRPRAISTGVDANQRMQVIRLARRGDRPEQIATELRVPMSEVELLLKVQRAMARVFKTRLGRGWRRAIGVETVAAPQ